MESAARQGSPKALTARSGNVPARPVIVGLSAGVLALAGNWLGHAVFGIPLLPQQAGDLVLKILPLPVFESLLKALHLLARPLLLLGASIAMILAYGVAAVLLARLWPRSYLAVMTGLVAVISIVIAALAWLPSDNLFLVGIEIIVLAVTIPLVAMTLRDIDADRASEDRRVLLRNLFFGIIGVSVLGIAYANVRRFTTALAINEGNRATAEVTPVSDFYVVSKNLGGDPVIDAGSWHLQLPGKSLTYQQLLALPAQRLELTLECISNDVGGTLISNGVWGGPRVKDVLALTTVPPDAQYMLIESADGYTESFLLSELSDDHLLATHLNGQPLPAAHGFPARFLFPGHYGMKQPKWVTRIHFSAGDQLGYWENNGWDERAIIKTMSRIDQPQDGASPPAGPVRFSGIAFAGSRRISGVELSWDGGSTWHAAQLEPEFAPNAWRFWSLTSTLSGGQYRVAVRARDGEGTLQTASPAPTLPNGADGYHSITIDLA